MGGSTLNRRRVELWAPLTLYLLFTLVPFYWIVLYAFRPSDSSSLLPWPLTFTHFQVAWSTLGFSTLFRNSVLVGLGVMLATNVIALAGGYALARYRFRGRAVIVVVLLCTQFVPQSMLLIPLFLIFKHIGLLNSLLCLVVSDTVFQLPLAALLMNSFIARLPAELEEAAMVDGCSRLRAFRAAILPLLRPALVAVGSFAFVGAWNNFLFALMFMNSQDKFTLPIGLKYLMGDNQLDFNALAAGGLLAAVPVVLVFAVIQKYLVQGLSAGAVKG